MQLDRAYLRFYLALGNLVVLLLLGLYVVPFDIPRFRDFGERLKFTLRWQTPCGFLILSMVYAISTE